MKETIFYLEGRGGMYLYHFIVFNLGGLYHILNKNYCMSDHNDSVLLDDLSKVVRVPSTEISFPIKIYMKDILPFQRQLFHIIKDKFELIDDLSTIEDYEIVSIYGTNTYIPVDIFHFIRNLIYEKMDYKMIPGKRIFITRKNSETQHDGTLKRCIQNEKEVIPMLNKYNFEYIQLENYNTHEKIKLFMESETILSSHSSALTFVLFANEKAKIIEILDKGIMGEVNCHYIDICKTINLNYNRYTSINEDFNGNFNLHVDEFEKYLISIL